MVVEEVVDVLVGGGGVGGWGWWRSRGWGYRRWKSWWVGEVEVLVGGVEEVGEVEVLVGGVEEVEVSWVVVEEVVEVEQGVCVCVCQGERGAPARRLTALAARCRFVAERRPLAVIKKVNDDREEGGRRER